MDNAKIYEALLNINQTLGGLSADMKTVKETVQNGSLRMDMVEGRTDKLENNMSFFKGKVAGISTLISVVISVVTAWLWGGAKH